MGLFSQGEYWVVTHPELFSAAFQALVVGDAKDGERHIHPVFIRNDLQSLVTDEFSQLCSQTILDLPDSCRHFLHFERYGASAGP